MVEHLFCHRLRLWDRFQAMCKDFEDFLEAKLWYFCGRIPSSLQSYPPGALWRKALGADRYHVPRSWKKKEPYWVCISLWEVPTDLDSSEQFHPFSWSFFWVMIRAATSPFRGEEHIPEFWGKVHWYMLYLYVHIHIFTNIQFLEKMLRYCSSFPLSFLVTNPSQDMTIWKPRFQEQFLFAPAHQIEVLWEC